MRPAFLVVDKPAGITSHDVVAMVRAVTGAKKVGHTGTLDPFATGVLPLALGPATRLISFLDEDLKIYDATIALGAATDTGDPTGTVEREAPVPELDEEAVREVLAGFAGVRMQTPPRYSAVKHKGKPLYAYAREGKEVEVAARPTRIDVIELLDLGADSLRVRIECGRGTYARVLADEIAEALGTAGHLSALRRTRSGPFEEADAMTLSTLAEIVAGRPDWEAVLRPARGEDRVKWRPRSDVQAGLEPNLMSPITALSHLGLAPIDTAQRKRLKSGEARVDPPSAVKVGDHFLAVDGDRVVAVMKREPAGSRIIRVFG